MNEKYISAPLSTFFLSYLFSSLIELLSVLFIQASPQALNLLIGFISSGEEHWKGYLYMLAHFLTLLLTSVRIFAKHLEDHIMSSSLQIYLCPMTYNTLTNYSVHFDSY